MQVSGNIGEKLDDMREFAEREEQQALGAIAALKSAVKTVAAMHAHVDSDFTEAQEGKSSAFPSGGTDLEIKAYVKKYIIRASEACDNLRERASSERLAKAGKVAAFKEAVKIAQGFHDASVKRAQQLQAMMEEAMKQAPMSEEEIQAAETKAREERKARGPGEHPGPSSLDIRRAQSLRKNVDTDEEEVDLTGGVGTNGHSG